MVVALGLTHDAIHTNIHTSFLWIQIYIHTHKHMYLYIYIYTCIHVFVWAQLSDSHMT